MWKRDEAIRLVTYIERALAGKWHAALAGGVLHRGESEHDLDVVVFPHVSTDGDVRHVHDSLEQIGMECYRSADEMRAGWRERGLSDNKHVEAWRTQDGRRVDVLVLR